MVLSYFVLTMMPRVVIVSMMAPELTTRYTGAVYHVVSRGARPSSVANGGRDVATRRKGDPAKAKLTAALRAETTMPLAWIAERLRMGSRGYLTWLLRRQAKPAQI